MGAFETIFVFEDLVSFQLLQLFDIPLQIVLYLLLKRYQLLYLIQIGLCKQFYILIEQCGYSMLQHRLFISQIDFFLRILAFFSPILIGSLFPFILDLRCYSLLFLLRNTVFQLIDDFLEPRGQLDPRKILKVFQTGDLVSEDGSCKM